MAYYFNKILKAPFNTVMMKVKDVLQDHGFGILTEIDVQATMKKKLQAEFRPYTILGACNPPFAYRALQAEDKIGTMLPCNVIVQQRDDGSIEVAAVDPIASMQAIANPDLQRIAQEVQDKLREVIAAL